MAGAGREAPPPSKTQITGLVLGVNSCFTPDRELCSVRCTEGDALRCSRRVGWYCRDRAGNFIVSFMPPAHLNTV